jgi:hypothetical protein
MKLKYIYLPLISLVALYLSACQKDFTVDDTIPPSVVDSTFSDTSKIFTQIEYNYANGIVTDSITYVVKNATINGVKRIKLSAILGPGDSAFALYIYNSQNQLTEIKYTNTFSAMDISRNIITWNGMNVTKIEYDSAGVVKDKYDLTYTSIGSNTKISYLRTPNTNLFISYSQNNTISYLSNYQLDFVVDANFKPNYIDYLAHSYINNGGGSLPSNRWITSKIKFNFSVNDDLISETRYGIVKDTNVNSTSIPTIGYGTDTLISNYARSTNDNLVYTNILKSIYGIQLYNLNTFYKGFLVDYLIGGGAVENLQFNNQALSTIDKNNIAWYNGIPDLGSTANLGIVTKYLNTFDLQNRLTKYIKYEMDQAGLFTIPTYGMRIIYP